MPDTKWLDLYEINELQTNIMHFVDRWVKKEKTPVPHSEIIKTMKGEGVKDFTTYNALQSLMKKGYLRKAIITSNKTFYVQLRRAK
jgi:Fe2+ or Zn2+ uptake regulation protein